MSSTRHTGENKKKQEKQESYILLPGDLVILFVCLFITENMLLAVTVPFLCMIICLIFLCICCKPK